VLQGLPETLEGWDRNLDCFGDLVAMLERSDRPRSEQAQTELLHRYRRVLAIDPVNADDLEKYSVTSGNDCGCGLQHALPRSVVCFAA
jgi:hypothetical protein